MPTFGSNRGHNKHAGKDLKNRPLRFVMDTNITSEELRLALRCLHRAYEVAPEPTPNGRHVTQVREWQRQCELAGLERPGKFRALSLAARAKGVMVDADGRVHWGAFSNGSPE